MTGLPIHFEFATAQSNPRLQPPVDLLNGIKRTADEPQLGDAVTAKVSASLGKGWYRVEAAVLSPDRGISQSAPRSVRYSASVCIKLVWCMPSATIPSLAGWLRDGAPPRDSQRSRDEC